MPRPKLYLVYFIKTQDYIALMIITNDHTSCDWMIFLPIICSIGFTDYGSGMVSWEQQDNPGWRQQWTGYQTCIQNIHKISCDLCHCKQLITHIDVMISIKRFSIHMFVSHPYPNPTNSKEQWCHGFVDSLSPKHKDIYGLTLSQVNPRPQRGLYNFNIIDKIIFIY